jgi:3-oxoadipate enol-lactonase
MNGSDVNGTSLRYDRSGSGIATLVLVHEIGATLDSWDQVLPALNNTCHVLRYDTRGAGLSEKIRGKVTFDDMADDLAALLDATGITGKVALAGTAVGATWRSIQAISPRYTGRVWSRRPSMGSSSRRGTDTCRAPAHSRGILTEGE